MSDSMTPKTHVTFIGATRASEDIFWSYSPLGLSIKRLESIITYENVNEINPDLVYRNSISFENEKGLPEVYNTSIKAILHRVSRENCDNILVFIHDDVWIEDAQIGHHLIAGLQEFDILGVAGSIRRVPAQACWTHLDLGHQINTGGMSGMIGHGMEPFGSVCFYGRLQQSCELLDGVFLAVRLQTLVKTGIRFDQSFDFHFYDMDFCRTARSIGLRLGTWPIALTHQSEGSFGGAEWSKRYADYLAKWGD